MGLNELLRIIIIFNDFLFKYIADSLIFVFQIENLSSYLIMT